MYKKFQITYLLSFSAILLFGQNITVNNINERRSTSDGYFDNKCEIELRVSGDEIRKFKFLKFSKIDKAIDDFDIDLLYDDKNDFSYEKIEDDVNLKLEIKKPSRKATVIKEISGEISLFNPTEANGSVVKISNYQAKTNENLLPVGLGVQVVFLTKESLEKFSKEQEKKKEEELKKLSEEERKMAEGLLSLLDGISYLSGDPNNISFYVEGDRSKLVDLYFVDLDGQKVNTNGWSSFNSILEYIFSEPINPKWTLVFNIETPESVKKIPFKISNAFLP